MHELVYVSVNALAVGFRIGWRKKFNGIVSVNALAGRLHELVFVNVNALAIGFWTGWRR